MSLHCLYLFKYEYYNSPMKSSVLANFFFVGKSLIKFSISYMEICLFKLSSPKGSICISVRNYLFYPGF